MKLTARTIVLITGALALSALRLDAHAQWTVDYTVRYEAAGQQTGKPGEPRGPDTLVSEKITWRVQQEVRGTLNYTQKVRGAVASNMPDKNNEQRYDSWISRSGRAGNPASLKLEAEEVTDSAAKLGKADGEGAGDINRQRAGKFGRVEYVRTRVAIAADGPSAARLNDPYMQIDRVDGKLHFEPPTVDIDPAQVRYAFERVTRMDKPAAAGEWDNTDARDGEQRTKALRLPLLPVQVFDIPRDAESFDAMRTVDVSGRIGGKATITIALRRAGATPSSAAASAASATTPAATTAAPTTAAARAKPNCPPASADSAATGAAAGAEVGGKALGGGYGRQVGSAIGGVLGALGGAIQRNESAAADCPR
jgi:hypothetical protein